MLNFRNLLKAKSSWSHPLQFLTMGFASLSTDPSTDRCQLTPLFGFSKNHRENQKWKKNSAYVWEIFLTITIIYSEIVLLLLIGSGRLSRSNWGLVWCCQAYTHCVTICLWWFCSNLLHYVFEIWFQLMWN